MFNRSRLPLSVSILPQHVNDLASNTGIHTSSLDLPSQSISQSILGPDNEPNFITGARTFFRPTMFRISVVIFYLVFGVLKPLFSYIKHDKVVFILELVFNIAVVNSITIINWRQEDRAPTEQHVTQAPIRDIQSILNPLPARDDAVAEGSAVYPRDSSQLHRRTRFMSRNEDDDTTASSVAASDYQSPGLGNMSDDESSSPIRQQDLTHAEGFSSSPPPAPRFFPNPTSGDPTTVTPMSSSHTASDLGSNDGNADIEVEDEDEQRQLLLPTPDTQERSASYHTQNLPWPSPAVLSLSPSQPLSNDLSSALGTAQDSASFQARVEFEIPNHRSQPYNPEFGFSADAEVFTDKYPAPKWNPPFPSSPPPVLFHPLPPPPPPYISPPKHVIHVYGNAKASINAGKHDNMDIHAFEGGQVEFNGYSQDDDDQADGGRRGGDAPVAPAGKKIKGRRQGKRRHEEPGHPRRRAV